MVIGLSKCFPKNENEPILTRLNAHEPKLLGPWVRAQYFILFGWSLENQSWRPG